jgi:primosomal protein N' (replication factor Y)
VEVEFGKKKKYSGIVKSLSTTNQWQKVKPILSVIDEAPVIHENQRKLWEWISKYYMCSIGEVMIAALPSSLKLESETKVYRLLDSGQLPEKCTDDEFLLLEALDLRNELSLQEIESILQHKSVLKLVKSMLEKGLLQVREDLHKSADVPQVKWLRLHDSLRNNTELFNQMLDLVQRSSKQTQSVLTYLKVKPNFDWIKRTELQKLSKTESAVTDALLKKNVLEEIELDRFQFPDKKMDPIDVELSAEQETCLAEIRHHWLQYQTVLLKGVTGSGKTMIYIRLILDALAKGQQVLYLVPEIALTHQLVSRLKQYLGDYLLEYHSELSVSSKTAVWKSALKDVNVFVGARSSLFLPFHNLGLIIVDEEHDQSYKQQEPAPRYHARDAALVMAHYFTSQVLLGSASPSVESHFNVLQQKYGQVVLDKRYGNSVMPEIKLISLKEAIQFGTLKGYFTKELLDEIQKQFDQQKQVIIFRNRRGYSPLLQCLSCNWEANCSQCDVHLTLHKYHQKLKCHICGLQKPIPSACPQCGQYSLRELGFGTEKIEEELQEHFPEKVIKRFDLDVAKGRKIQQQIMQEFEDGETHILVGTQMITKGLDFTNVGLVGIIQADQIINYPDFRSQERAFQLLTQVGGRSGRRENQGKVIIQAYAISHPVILDISQHDDATFYKRELLERKKFHYPPYIRLLRIELRHIKIEQVDKAASTLCQMLAKKTGRKVLGPAEPHVSKIRGAYVREVVLKLEKNTILVDETKNELLKICNEIKSKQGFSTLRVIFHVDPY